MSTYEDKLTGRLPLQSLLRGRYRILSVAGRGGMSAVYKAIDMQQNSLVAVKEMSQGHLNDEERQEAIARFQQEYRMLNQLRHPHVPLLHDIFQEQDRFFIVMDYIDGKTLFELLRRQGGPLQVVQVLAYAVQLCDVLTYLHSQQPPIIFRDLKPTNVMIRQDGQLFLIDFGIARNFKEGQVQDTTLLGSPGYAPPEQHGSAQTNPRSDVYALGATMHYCLTGRDPFSSHDYFMFQPIRQFNPQVPAELDLLVQRMLAPNEHDRPGSAQEVKQSLLAIQQHATDATSNIAPVPGPAPSAPTLYAMPASPAQQNQPAPPGSQPSPQLPTMEVQPVSFAPFAPSATQLAQPQRVGQPLQARQALARKPIWTPAFLALFCLTLALTVIGSIITFNISNPYGPGNAAGLDHAVEFVLAALAVVTSIAASAFIRRAFPLSILLTSALALSLTAFAFLVQTVRDLNPGQFPVFLSQVNPDQFLIGGLLASSIVSMLWLLRPNGMFERTVLLVAPAIALICSLLVFTTSGDGDVNRHLLLLTALIALIQGILLATRVDRA